MSKIYNADQLSNEEYHGDKTHISSSMLKELYKDPYEFYKLYVERSKEKKFYNMDALHFGSLCHSLLFEPETVEDLYTSNKEEKDKIYIPDLKMYSAKNIIDTLKEHDEVKKIMKTGQPELSIFTKIQALPTKVRFDWSSAKLIADLKTTSREKLHKKGVVEDVIGDLMYELSASLYMDAYFSHYKKRVPFYFIFVSTKDGSTCVGRVTDQMYEDGRAKYQEAIKQYKKLKKTGDWAIRDLYLPEKYQHRG